jgi:hypothetical protein
MCEYAPHNPAHSAAWHVGPDVGDPSLRGLSPGLDARVSNNSKKRGAPSEHPQSLLKNYRFFAAFFFAALAFFAMVFSLGCATQPPTVCLTVTTGGLSHPPSYQM